MPYDFPLSALESSPKYQQAPFEVRQELSREYLKENGPQAAVDQLAEFTSTQKFAALPPEEQASLKSDYMAFYGLQPDAPYDIVGGIKDVGKLLYDVPVQVKGAIGDLLEGDDPEAEKSRSDEWRAERDARTAQRTGEISAEDRAKKVFPLPEFLSDKGAVTRGDIQDTSSSTGFSGVSMGAGLVGAGVGSVAGPWGTAGGGMAASGAAAFKMSKTQVAQQLFSAAEQVKGEKLTGDERKELLDRTASVRNDYALWEAGPEAVGNALEMTGIGNIFKGAAKGATKKIVTGLITSLGGELSTETVTQVGQNIASHEMGLGEGSKMSFTDPASYAQALKEVAPQVVTLTGLMGGGAAVTGKATKMALSIGDAEKLAKDIPLNADPADIVKTIEQANGPIMTVGNPPLSDEQQADLSAFTQKAATMTLEQAQKARNSLPNVYRVSPQLGEQVNAIINGRIAELTTAQADQFEQTVPAAEQASQATQQQINVADTFDDLVAQEEGVQDQADTRARSNRFEQLKQRVADRLINQDELQANTTGRPSTAQEAAGVFDEVPQTEAEKVAARREDAVAAFSESPERTTVDHPESIANGHEIDTPTEAMAEAGNSPAKSVPGQSVPKDDTIGNQSALDSGATYTKLFGNDSNAKAVSVKRFDSVDRDVQHMILSKVVRELDDNKVFYSVVKAVPIDVVNMLVGEQVSPDMLLHNKSMLTGRLSVPRDIPVPKSVSVFVDALSSVLKGRLAGGGAKELGLARARSPVSAENRSAIGTDKSSPHIKSSVVGGKEVLVNINPTEAQKQAGNYLHGSLVLDGLDISIENPVGSIRKGRDKSGREWQQELKADYGYIKGSVGKDKDHLDVFIKPGHQGGGDIYVVNQYNQDGSFDEHKAVAGASSEQEALDIYNSNYEAGWTGGKSVTKMSAPIFKKWAKSKGPSLGPVERKSTIQVQPSAPPAEEASPAKPTTTQPGEPRLEKEPWQMNQEEYVAWSADGKDPDSNIDSRTPVTIRENAIAQHKKKLFRAMRKGKPVPAEVLADYPDLKPTPSAVPAESRQQGEKVEPEDQSPPAKPDGRDIPGDAGRDEVKTGNEGTAETENGKEISFKWAIVEASDLIASNDHDTFQVNPKYPAELQPRKRENAAYQLQVTKIANNMKPARLATSNMVSDGAPIVGPDMAVESGNGRTIAIKKAYAEGKYTRYKDWIAKHAADFGLSQQDIDGMASPVLVRIRTTEMSQKERVSFASDANESGVTKMSDVEQASIDAQKLDTLDDFNPSESGEFDTAANRGFIRRFVSSVVAGSEQNGMYIADGSALSQSGKTRIRNAVFVKAYGANAKVLSLVVESTDNNIRNITNGMLLAAPKIAKMKSDIAAGRLYDIDISEPFARVVEDYAEIVAAKKTVSYELAQLGMFGDKRTKEHKEMLSFLEENKRSGKKIALFLTQFVNGVYNSGDPKQLSMFGGSIKPTTENIIGKSILSVKELGDAKQGRLFGEVGKDGKRPTDGETAGRLDGGGEEGRTATAEEPPSGISRGTVKEGGVKYETTVNRLVDVRDRKGRKIQGPTQMSLFAAPTVQPKEQRAAKRRLFAEVKHSSAGSFTFDGKADNFATIAQIAAPIMSQAQENNIIVMTDENDMPVVVLRHSVGATHMAPVQAPFILGVAHSIPSVKNIWFAHNHPSGGEGLSAQDVGVSHMLSELAKDTGITVRGIIAVTPQGKYYGQGVSGNDTGDVNAGGKSKVGGISRSIVKLSDQDAIVNSVSLERWVKENAAGETGVLLLDNSHRPNAFVPMTVTEMQTARTGEKGTGASWIFDAINKTNSIAAVIVTNTSVKTSELRNIVKFIDANQLRILDTIQNGKADNRFVVENILGLRFKTGETQPNAFFSTSLPPNQQADTPSELRAKLGRGYDALIRSGKMRLIETQREAQRIIEMIRGGVKYSRYSNSYPKVRGGWTIEKIERQLKSALKSSTHSAIENIYEKRAKIYDRARQEISKFDSPDEFLDHLYWHGTGGYVSGGLKPGYIATRRGKDIGGGGYGESYHSISVSKSKNIASNFTGTSGSGQVYPVVLKKGADVISMPEIHDAVELEDILADLYEKKVDAVKIGDWSSESSEQELVIINPQAIIKFAGEGFRVYQKQRFTNPTLEEVGKIFDAVKAAGDKRLGKDENGRDRFIEVFYSEDGKTIQGFAANGVSHLVADGIAKGQAYDIIVHEMGWHVQNALQSSPTFKRILRNFESRLDEQSPEGKIFREAMAQVPKDTPAEHRTEEALAYAIANNSDTGIVRRFIALVKNLLVKMGINPRIFSVADLRALAEVAVRREAKAALREEVATDKESLSVGQFAQSVKLSVKEAARKIQGMEAFKKWFSGSVVTVDGKAGGEPLVVYHGTRTKFDAFDKEKIKSRFDMSLAFHFTDRPSEANIYAEGPFPKEKGVPGGAQVIPVYISLKNPLIVKTKELSASMESDLNKHQWIPELVRAKRAGTPYDGVIIKRERGDEWDGINVIVWEPTQIKSIFNPGLWSPTNPDIMMSVGSNPVTTADQDQNIKDVFGTQKSYLERAQSFKDNWQKELQQGLFDQYAPLFELTPEGYMQARMTKGGDSTLEAIMMYGKPYYNKEEGAIKVEFGDDNKAMNGFASVLAPLDGEHDLFLKWVSAFRASKLKEVGLENLMTDENIASLKTLSDGTMRNGKPRLPAYKKALKGLNDFNDAVLKIAVERGLINDATRQMYRDTPYLPFYRIAEESGVNGFTVSAGLVNQYSWKRLKGGTAKLNDDMLANLLQNWSHLITASARNEAAKTALEAAVEAGVAEEVPNGFPGKGLVSFKDNVTTRLKKDENGNYVREEEYIPDGDLYIEDNEVRVSNGEVQQEVNSERTFIVHDPHILDAIISLGSTMKVPKVLSMFKHFLTIGVTANPAFKVRNLLRDSLQSMALADMSYNPVSNVAKGFKLAKLNNETRAQLLASGGIIRFGAMLDGQNADNARELIERAGIPKDHIIDDRNKVAKLWKHTIKPAIDVYQEFGDRGEQVNRLALYDRLIKKGMTHGEASFWARDLMDFSMSGKWAAVRFLTKTVPFLNARLEGLYKLGKSTKADKKRVGIVVGGVVMASLTLLGAYGDDDDWKKREDWDRDNYWWFKAGGIAFRIPKPFEIGAIGTLAERSAELFFDKEMTGKRFRERLSNIVSQQLNMNPTPQLVKPLIDLWANKDSFSGRPIESMGMERLRPEDRFSERTSGIAKTLGSLGLPNPAQLLMGNYEKLSPAQIDFMVKGYFSWLGTMTTAAIDYGIYKPLSDNQAPAMKLKDVFFVGNFAETLPSGSSRYVTQMYEQAKEIEQAYSSYQNAVKSGDKETAKSIMESDKGKIENYKKVEGLKRKITDINREIKKIQADTRLDSDKKRELIDNKNDRKDKIARLISAM